MYNSIFFNKLDFFIKFSIFLWIISIPFKNIFYHFSIFLIIGLFVYSILKYNHIQKLKEIFTLYIDIFLLFISFVLLMLFSTIINLFDIKQVLLILKYIIRYGFVFFILLYFYKNKKININLLSYFILSSFFLVGLNGYYEYFTTTHGRLEGNMFNQNTFGFYMSLASIFSTIVLFHTKNKFFIFYFLFFIFLTILSGSRSSYLMYLSFFLMYIILNYKKINKEFVVLLVLVCSMIFVLIYSEKDMLQRFMLIFNQGYSSNRYEIWELVFSYIKSNPILGHGVDSMRYLIPIHHTSAHNNILDVLLNIGLSGFVLLSFFLFRILKEILFINNYAYLSIFISFLVVSNFDHNIFTNKIFLSVITIFAFFIFSHRIDSKKHLFNSIKDII